MPPGATLADLLITLAILAVLLAMAAPRLVRARDAYAVRGARDAAASLIERAAALAGMRGGARLQVDPGAGELRAEAPPGQPAGQALRLTLQFGVVLSVDGHSGPLALDFDGLGLGSIANRTLRFRRGGEEARLSLSLYGRPRQW